MKRASIIIALSAVALVSSDVLAQKNDQFARQRRAAAARQNTTTTYRHWGGPTTTSVNQQNVQYVPVAPFGHGFGFGVGYPVRSYPNYAVPRQGGYGWNPYYGYPLIGAPINHVFRHHQIIIE